MANIAQLAEELGKLTVLEAVDLVKQLEETWGVSAAAPVAMMAGPAAGGAPVAEEKTDFDVILKSPGGNKIGVIKVVRELTGLGLKEAKDLTETAGAKIKEGLGKAEIDQIVSQTKALQERQNQKPDASLLPKVELSDVPADIAWPAGSTSNLSSGIPLTFYAQGTNGLSYQQLVLTLPELTGEQTSLLPYYTSCLPEVGVGTRSYLDIQSLQAGVSGGINAYTSMRSKVRSEQEVQAYLVLSSKALYRKQEELTRLLADTLQHCRFDELDRIGELMEQILGRKEQSITSQGHSLAMGAACSRMSPLALLGFQSGGLEGIRKLKQLVKSLDDQASLRHFAQQLAATHAAVIQIEPRFLLIAEASEDTKLMSTLTRVWQAEPVLPPDPGAFSLAPVRGTLKEGWLTSTQVNFCAMAFPTVTSPDPDAAALTVLGGFMRNGYLHRAIREQGGAYGGGASQDSSSAAFRFYSYRDPRLSETLEDYQRAIDWMMRNTHDYSQLEEAILGVISSLDKPASPAGSAKQAFHNELFGRDKAQRARFRQQVLDVSIEQLKSVTEKYLDPAKASIAVISNKSHQKELEGLGLDIQLL